MTDKLAQIKVTVSSIAKPIPGSLMAARTAIRVCPEFQDVFKQARAESWPAEALADALFIRLPDYLEDTEDLWETCLYLADEFLQLGDQILLVSPETGMAIAKVSEKDVYLPAPVLRETGELAQPLPRLRPELEGLIVQWGFRQSKDQQVLQTLAKRVPSSALLTQEGDNRLLRATTKGRKQLVDQLRDELPTLLPPESGMTKEFFDLFRFCMFSEVPKGFEACPSATALAHVITPVTDPLTFNLRHDPYTTLKRQITSQWSRDIARFLANFIYAKTEVIEASVFDPLPTGFLLANPNVAMAFRGRVLPIAAVSSVLLHSQSAPIAYLYIRSNSYTCNSREFLEIWEVTAECEFTFYLKPETFSAYHFNDVPQSGVYAEVLA